MQESVITIRTLECDICRRFDSIMMSLEEIKARAQSTDMGIGAYSVPHNDHTRIVYFDEKGEYLGDTIALSHEELPDILKSPSIPFYIINKKKSTIFKKMRALVNARLYSKNLSLAIVGPSRAGKTSLVRYLSTLIPEREGQIMSSLPTMGKSVKRIKLGNSNLFTMDMGGQEDFWDLWEEPIEEADAVIFIFDATSNNLLEVAKAFEKMISYRKKEIPTLVLLNKKDIALRGQSSKFSTTGEFLSLTRLELPIPNVLGVETSIFEGKAYLPSEELPLAEVISSFLKDYSL